MSSTPITERSPALHFRREDDPDWHWLESRDDPQVKAFLRAANRESDRFFAPLQALEQALYDGHLARRELAVTGLPTDLERYRYWSETAAEADYPLWWRQPVQGDGALELLLDLEARSQAHDYLELGDMAISSDEQWIAWTEDASGNEYFDLYLKSLPDGEPRRLRRRIGPELVWAEDNRTLLFTRYDATQRPASVWSLRPADDVCRKLYEEQDVEFWIGLGKTRSRQWLVLETASKDTSECHVIPALDPTAPARCVRPREAGVEYGVDHRADDFYILHNRDAPHFRLDVAPIAQPDQWTPLLGHRDEVTLEDIDTFDWGLVLTERDHQEAQVHLRVIELGEGRAMDGVSATMPEPGYRLPLPEAPCSLALGDTPDFSARRLRLREESFTLPVRWIEHDLDSGERRLLKTQPIHGDLQPDALVCRRLWAQGHDGEHIPVSVVARAEDLKSGPLPTLLYGYGAYGEVLDPWFSVARLELLSHGVAFAVAHVRGGGDRGEPWYLAGKLEHKENSFRDFLAARHALVAEGISEGARIAAYGASAGGLLVGASLNLEPEAFCAAVLDVPFVDVLRTMENPDLPLTTAEYTEWGNPDEPAARRRIRDYSPLDNLTAQPYPSVFLQGSWHDSRVPYWEPAKLYARMTELASARGPVLLRTDMASGHGGASGRFKAWRDNARQDAFVLWTLGCAGQTEQS
ncbi:S9 family peptidase [Salinicola rhizosphaerae]|uniref:Oligopeptidase n=1 Tax=Salinicola rhizosphaerae TaxID=1443141 RepID=A0ABQ3EB51_9GAMM|nr:prolyl oligopeptidase family serine peptidase [Salinicola rhizosphaerae]GHB29383.1 oligopeptidase [Salinicola rhizosphaerae]